MTNKQVVEKAFADSLGVLNDLAALFEHKFGCKVHFALATKEEDAVYTIASTDVKVGLVLGPTFLQTATKTVTSFIPKVGK